MRNEYVGLMFRQRNGGSYLVYHHVDGDYWCFPGGKPRPGESLPAALRREIREEMDIVPDAIQYIGTFENVVKGTTWTGHFYLPVTWNGGLPRIVEVDKFDRMEYMTLAQLRAFPHRPEWQVASCYEVYEKQYNALAQRAFEWYRDGKIDAAGREELLLQGI